MACEFRAIWVLHQSSHSKGNGASLLTSRRFPTVEKRVKNYYESQSATYSPILSDKELVTQFNACILKDSFSTLDFDDLLGVPALPGSGRKYKVFLWDQKVEDGQLEKEWPLGPTASLGGLWPFIFISTTGSYEETVPPYSDRYFICGLVATYKLGRVPLIELPQVTSGYKVLEDLVHFLPSTSISRPHISVATKFQFYLKCALPFGSPVTTSVFLLDQFNTVSSSSMDAQVALSQFASTRVPSWKPFFVPVSNAPGLQVPSHLRLEVEEKITLSDTRAAIHGAITCECDISGTPEVVLVLQAPQELVLTTHACAKLVSDEPNRYKLAFVPMSTRFEVCRYQLSKESSFVPIFATFRLFQIAPRRCKFELSLKAAEGVLFSYLSVSFGIAETDAILVASLSHLVYSSSSRTKVDLVNGTRIVWSLKNPSPQGETVEGVAELGEDFGLMQQISNEAKIEFIVSNNFSTLSIPTNLITIFPSPPKHSTVIKWETRSASELCTVVNSCGHKDR